MSDEKIKTGTLVLFDYEDTLSSSTTGEPLPGVKELLSSLHENGMIIGLVTGAYTESAAEFLERHGLSKYFSSPTNPNDLLVIGSDLGGSLYSDRLNVAIRTAEEMSGQKFGTLDIFVFDDRESRVAVVAGMGIKFIAVATGDSRRSDFQKCTPRPYRIFSDLTNTLEIVSAILDLDIRPRKIL